MTSSLKQPSLAPQPDLDWSQIRETVRMLHLAVAQIEMSLREGDESVETLSKNFTAMIGSVENISEANKRLACREENLEISRTVEAESGRISAQMHESIIAFQFYDKLSQRLSHVSHALGALAMLVNDRTRLYQPHEWADLQGSIRARYTMREEQEMFDILLAGGSVDEALAKGMAARHAADGEDVELF